jgi:hypothetical protein
MGAVLHAQWRMHQGVRRRRQSALSAGDGAPFHRKGRARITGASAPRNRKISRPRPRRDRAVEPAARSKAAGAAGSEISFRSNAGRAAGLRILHRLQCVEDAAHCAACARHHGCAWHLLPGDGGTEPLLRRDAASPGRRRDVRPDGHEQRRQALAFEIGSGDFVVPELLRPVHGNNAAGNRAPARHAALRDDAVPGVFSRDGSTS